MKTKLFSLFIAVFLFSASGKAQTPCVTDNGFPCITLIGSGAGGWTNEAEKTMLTSDGITYTLVDVILTKAEVKFREGRCWEGGCPAGTGNIYGWGPVKAADPLLQSSGWPSGVNATPGANGPNIQSEAGVWTVTFNRIQGSWSFVAGTPLPVVKVFGTATNPTTGVAMSTVDGTVFTVTKIPFIVGTAQFDVNGSALGGLTFPTGIAADPSEFIPVSPANDYTVSYNLKSGAYSFVVATFPEIGLIGSGTTGTEEGWNADIAKMTTTDGITYTLKNQQLYSVNSNTPNAGGPGVPGPAPSGVKFRTYGAWTQDWGGTSFPTGPIAGNNGNIGVTADGVYDITFNKTTGAYTFSFPEIGLIGSGTTGTQAGWDADIAKMATSNGVNYTLTQQLYSVNSNAPDAGGPGVPGPAPAKVKFRTFGAWSQDWGGTSFPTGPIAGNNGDIVVTAPGTYAINFNRLTGAYDFGTALAVKNFNAKSFSAYPNPTRNSWNIVSGNDDITSVQVFDMLGKSVYNKAASSKEVNVNASALSQGVYFARVSTAKGTSTVKLVKE